MKKINPSAFTKAKKLKSPKQKQREAYALFYGGIGAAFLGIILFNFGITFGLEELGEQTGSVLPGAFTKISTDPYSPDFPYGTGMFIMISFSWVLGYLVTQAEPALHVLGDQVEEVGVMRKRTLIFLVSAGVGTGFVIGVLLVIFQLDLIYFLISFYTLALILTALSSEFLVNVAWDSAAVTTGDVTVPFVLVLGVNLAEAVGGVGGFGILAMASLIPIIAVLMGGFFIKFQTWLGNRGLQG